jgi:anthranilate phosphoribosyltransferase
MEFKTIINMLMEGHLLDETDAYQLMNSIGTGVFNEGQKTALIIALSSRDIALPEIIGFRKALLELSIKTTFEFCDAIDLCGTGGDNKQTFNISTLAAIIVASCGYKVVKHGNYAVSSVSGSSNLLQELGYKFTNDTHILEKQLTECNICFLHAPLFHPALKNVAQIRSQLGIKTIFNTLGPLVNPVKPKKQIVGVNSIKLARLYHYILQADDKDYIVVHSLDGFDEISLTDNAIWYSSVDGEQILSPSQLGFPVYTESQLYGGTHIQDAIQIFINIIEGKGTPAQNDVVIVNAAAAILCFEKNKTLSECVDIARDALFKRKTKLLLNKLINQSY